MTKSKEFEIRKLLFRLLIYNLYKYDLKEMEYYSLMDFMAKEVAESNFKLIDKLFKNLIIKNLSVKWFCTIARDCAYDEYSCEELINKLLIDHCFTKR
jgi:pectate lyase